jgi:hypothetical protein
MTTLLPARRRVAAVSAPLFLALSLTACGGGGSEAEGAPEDASSEDFCAAFQDIGEDFDSDDTGQAVDAANEYGANLAEVGTPSDFSEDARTGFETYVGFLEEVDEGDVEELESSESAEDVFGDDAEAVTAFLTEAATVCAPELGDLEGELGELESELPE